MTSQAEDTATDPLPPDEAFAIVGNDTRMAILQALGETEHPCSFTELRTEVGFDDPGNFQYHLDKLTGHFVAKVKEGYQLRQAGRRVIEAVLSGAVGQAPELERTQIDVPCTLCEAPSEVTFYEERLEVYCTECSGTYGESSEEQFRPAQPGYLGHWRFPPAGVRNRTAKEVYLAAHTWGTLDQLAFASDVCPRCSASVDHEIHACPAHDSSDGLCPECDRRYAIMSRSQCTNCIAEAPWGIAHTKFIAETPVQHFLTSHGINLVSPASNEWARFSFDEEVLSTDPFEGRLTFTVADETLALTVDDSLSVIDVSKTETGEAG